MYVCVISNDNPQPPLHLVSYTTRVNGKDISPTNLQIYSLVTFNIIYSITKTWKNTILYVKHSGLTLYKAARVLSAVLSEKYIIVLFKCEKLFITVALIALLTLFRYWLWPDQPFLQLNPHGIDLPMLVMLREFQYGFLFSIIAHQTLQLRTVLSFAQSFLYASKHWWRCSGHFWDVTSSTASDGYVTQCRLPYTSLTVRIYWCIELLIYPRHWTFR